MAYARESGRLIRLSKYIAHAHPKACDIGSMRGSSSAFAIVSIQQLATNTKCSDRFAHDLLLCTEERPGTYSMRPAELLNQLAKAYKFKAGLILGRTHPVLDSLTLTLMRLILQGEQLLVMLLAQRQFGLQHQKAAAVTPPSFKIAGHLPKALRAFMVRFWAQSLACLPKLWIISPLQAHSLIECVVFGCVNVICPRTSTKTVA